jgi:16S rRNA (uracil1498-N3)-methyltransferase
MNRFYISQTISGDTVTISDPVQLHHMRDVLRLEIGDEIAIFDSLGNEYLCTITRLDRANAVLNIKNQKTAPPKRLDITIACAIPKKARMDDIIDKLTQLGVDTIIPLNTERGIVKIEEDHNERLERWRKIALNASEQSHRNRLPYISPVKNFKEIFTNLAGYDLKLIPTLVSESHPLSKVLSMVKPAHILVLIGPEGDFSPAEVNQALDAGFIPVSLGDTVLRVETAAVAIAGYLILALLD